MQFQQKIYYLFKLPSQVAATSMCCFLACANTTLGRQQNVLLPKLLNEEKTSRAKSLFGIRQAK
jgi:hypothetical protein